MDPSMSRILDESESPTQVNEGRSYDRYEDPASLPSIHLRPTQDQNGLGDDFLERSLDENDTGAVNFDSLGSGGLDVESPTAADGERRRNVFFPYSDNDPISTTVGIAPETPAAPKNPFAGKFQTPLVAGSQLFAQTPFSAAFKQASPTSSRPSPSDLPAQAATPHIGISSPLKPRFPTPHLGEQTPMPIFNTLSTSSQSRFDAITPFPGEPAGSPVLQQSSPTNRRKRTPAPIAEYEPMRKSQERRDAAAEVRPDPENGFGSSSEVDADDASQERRRIVRQKKEQATKILSTISMSGATFRDDIVEVPASTRKEAWPQPRGKQASSRILEMCPESDPLIVAEATAIETVFEGPRSSLPESEVYEEVGFSQSIIDAYSSKVLPATKTPSSSATSLPKITSTVPKQHRPPLHPRSSLNETDAIPETSPVGIRLSTATKSPIQLSSDAYEVPTLTVSGNTEQSPLPQRPGAPYSSAYEQQNQHDCLDEVVSLLKQGGRRGSDAGAATSSPPVAAPSALSTRPRKKRVRHSDEESTGRHRTSLATSTSSVDRSASSLSSLSATPTQLSREGTPITTNDSDLSTHGSDKKLDAAVAATSAAVADKDSSSPHASRGRRMLDASSLPKLKQVSGHSKKAFGPARRQLSPFHSGSISELVQSPSSVVTFGRTSRTSRKLSTRSANTEPAAPNTAAHRRHSSAPGLFAGMVFAVSFQSRRRGENSSDFTKREKQGEILQERIREAGGKILADGFGELFQPPRIIGAASRLNATPDAASSELQLLPKAAETGFTALIADGHSRKAKYMQALALGLPCLAPRWVAACLDRNELVDWSPYLLCAGESSFLGGAIRSRNLAPYDASPARLAGVVQKREKLLNGLSILIVLRKAVESSREAYIFLAHVLGASLSRACSLEEARDQLKAMEDSGHPYDWVYTGEKTEPTGLFQDRSGPPGKKRKRPGSINNADRAPALVKTLSDERFIQSLIFGELIEEDDLGD